MSWVGAFKKIGAKNGLAVLVAILVVWEIHIRLRATPVYENQVRVLVAKRDLHAGNSLALQDFTFKLGDRSEFPYESVTDQELVLIKGASLRSDLLAGNPLRFDQLISDARGLTQKIPAGFRAHALQFERTIPVFSGDKIDVFLSGDTDPIVENLLVLRVENQVRQTTVIVSAGVREITDLERARGKGKLVLALRNPKDSKNSQRYQSKGKSMRRINKVMVITEGGE